MTVFFLTCAALGGGILVVQLLLGALGLGGALDDAPGGAPGDGLHLFSVRALSAGLAFFGLGGLAGLATGWGLLAALPLALLLGAAAVVAVAVTMRTMLRLEDDGTVQIAGAIGTAGIVYLSIPGERQGAGKVHLTVQGRTVEYQAVTAHRESLPTGTRILVVDVIGSDVVEVVPDPLPITNEVSHALL